MKSIHISRTNTARSSIGASKPWGLVLPLLALLLGLPSQRHLLADDAPRPTAVSNSFALDSQHMLPVGLYGERPAGTKIDTVVIHYISAVEVDSKKAYDLNIILGLFRPNAAEHRPATSAHYLIDRSGKVFLLVPESKRAWHAGASRMPLPDKREKVNDFSIGIELVQTAYDYTTDNQYEALARLICDIKKRHTDIKADNIVGHDMIRAGWNVAHPNQRAFVKVDPGPLFHWSRLMRRLEDLEWSHQAAQEPTPEKTVE